MKILVTGASGLVGTALQRFLARNGHQVLRLVRSIPKNPETEIRWQPESGVLEADRLEGLDAVVHLAGENLASGRWTAKRKQRIRSSRVESTALLSNALTLLKNPPKVLLSASATGFYGDRGSELLTEESRPGSGFLAEVCQKWEAATQPAAQHGIRVACMRFGVILSPAGGAVGKMLLPFRLGLGGVLGSGEQYWSWIALEDVVQAIGYLLASDITGPVNLVSPQPVTNRELTQALGKLLSRPTLLSVPAFGLRLALGEMADEALLSSVRVEPAKLLARQFSFSYPELEVALRYCLKSS